LIYLTDVAGVLNGERVLSVVTVRRSSVWSNSASFGGHGFSARSRQRAIEGGVREVRIVGGTSPGALLLASQARSFQPSWSGLDPWNARLRVPLSAAQAALSAHMGTSSKRSPVAFRCASPNIRGAKAKPDTRLLDAENSSSYYKRSPWVMTTAWRLTSTTHWQKYLDFLAASP